MRVRSSWWAWALLALAIAALAATLILFTQRDPTPPDPPGAVVLDRLPPARPAAPEGGPLPPT